MSLLEGSEIWEFQLEGLAERCRASGIQFHRFPVRDQHVPSSLQEFGALTEQLARDVTAGRSVVVHCEHGISRSSMMAAGVLARLGVAVVDGLALIGGIRGLTVPRSEHQAEWLKDATAAWNE